MRILDDGYRAALFVSTEINPFPSLKQVYLAIENAKVTYGIDDEAVDKLMKEAIKGKEVVIAEGKLPVGGGDARLIWNLGSEDGVPPTDITDQLNGTASITPLFGRVSKGQQILLKMPATEGMEGITVFGESKVNTGADIAIPQGTDTYLSSDELTLLATTRGIASWSGELITVSDVKHINGSVDSQSGDVRVEGAIHIEKDVRAGFRVEAVGDIYIGGNIEGADVYSRSGNVVVRNGVIGQNRARVLAGRNIVAGFIQDSTVGAKQDVEVGRYIINSAITAGRYISAISREGLIRGGTCFAGRKIEIRVGGSDGRIATELKVGYTPPESALKAKADIRAEQRRNRMELAYVQKRLQFLTLLKEHSGGLTEDKELQLRELQQKAKVLVQQHQQIAAKESEINGGDKEGSEKSEIESIRIHDTIFPEVSVGLGNLTMTNVKERSNIMFFRVGESMKMGPLNAAMRKA
ncbi:MAG: FapA family protein [Candidatus Neomarinimicrobiota bacterium]